MEDKILKQQKKILIGRIKFKKQSQSNKNITNKLLARTQVLKQAQSNNNTTNTTKIL